jgi:hypothetical protein
MTLTDVEIGHARPARSPDTKAAINYLVASGTTAINLTEADGVCAFHIGSKMIARSVAIFWIMEVDAKPVVTSARKIAGKSQGAAEAIAALHRAASDKRAMLTPHDVAMARAGNATATKPIFGLSAGLRRASRIHAHVQAAAHRSEGGRAGLHDVQERPASVAPRVGPALGQRASRRPDAVALRGDIRRRLIEPARLGITRQSAISRERCIALKLKN